MQCFVCFKVGNICEHHMECTAGHRVPQGGAGTSNLSWLQFRCSFAISMGCIHVQCASTTQTALPSTTSSNCKDLLTHCISLHYSIYSSILAPLKMMSLTRSLFLHVLTGILIEGTSHDNHLREIYRQVLLCCQQARYHVEM